MKTIAFLLIFVIPIPIFANNTQQKRTGYTEGGIISLNNDTIAASIKMENILKLQTEVKFIDAGGKKKSFKPGVINGFFMDTENGRVNFESRDDIRISVFPSKKGNFVLRLTDDIYPLYYFVTTKMQNTGIESEMTEIPHYLVHMDYRWYHFNENNFEDCVTIFKEDKGLVKDIKNERYSFSDFPEIVERYCNTIKSIHK
ncbi:hypothetical protein OU798_19160 [Prolixibacteraceae bacterium Z1-6]|uniref:DUF4468 domain-containing protein n=1 Tax=Draconibacterium aestuarii TaxID=2998507 RepID=A0A9X3FA45_9BACT|nr:hypothetical protein [Prolixibacteraceae bacterium Z1-6]